MQAYPYVFVRCTFMLSFLPPAIHLRALIHLHSYIHTLLYQFSDTPLSVLSVHHVHVLPNIPISQ